MLTSGKIPWFAVTLHRMCIITFRGCDKGPVCLQFLFQLMLLVADMSHLCGLNLSDKGGARFTPGTSFIHVSDLFLLPWPPRIHIAFIRVVEEEGEWGWGGVNATLWNLGATVENINSFLTDVEKLRSFFFL